MADDDRAAHRRARRRRTRLRLHVRARAGPGHRGRSAGQRRRHVDPVHDAARGAAERSRRPQHPGTQPGARRRVARRRRPLLRQVRAPEPGCRRDRRRVWPALAHSRGAQRRRHDGDPCRRRDSNLESGSFAAPTAKRSGAWTRTAGAPEPSSSLAPTRRAGLATCTTVELHQGSEVRRWKAILPLGCRVIW